MSHYPYEDTLRLGNLPEVPQLLRGGARIEPSCPNSEAVTCREPRRLPVFLLNVSGPGPAMPACTGTWVDLNEAWMEAERRKKAKGGKP